MIAVYYVESAGPYTMYNLPVKNVSKAAFLEAIRKHEMPMPDNDILFIEDDEVHLQAYLKDM